LIEQCRQKPNIGQSEKANMDNKKLLEQLLKRLDNISQKQVAFSKEIHDVRNEIIKIQQPTAEIPKVEDFVEHPQTPPLEIPKKEEKVPVPPKVLPQLKPKSVAPSKPKINKPSVLSSGWEKFIGENLINKIGIIILVIGVGIGAKYSIENDLISPLTRIILGYVAGLGLMAFGIKLKAKYKNYSAVLVSGAIAIMYFITFAAYSFYDLIPQAVAFGLMVLFTIFAVVAAINYNKQVIAHIGLVGAYTVPFLLSNDSGDANVLFTYMAVINAGILGIAFFKYWKPLYYSSFIFTWLIYGAWLGEGHENGDLGTALLFASVFFILFYLIFLSYKLIKKEKFNIGDILLLLANSFVYYGIGYYLLSEYYIEEVSNVRVYPFEHYLGLFTLANAVIHFLVAGTVFKQKLGDRHLFYFVSGLVIVFITIAIPVQLDGNWVTLLWIAQGALLFWIGRMKQIKTYEWISYGVLLVAGMSLLHDWGMSLGNIYGSDAINLSPFLNINFLTGILVAATLGLISYWNSKKDFPSTIVKDDFIRGFITFAINAALFGTIYMAVCLEISAYFDQLSFLSAREVTETDYDYTYTTYDKDLMKFKTLWIINFSMLFLTVLSFINMKKIKNRTLGFVNIAINIVGVFVFLLLGLFVISLLRDSYISQTDVEYYSRGGFHIAIRYISIGFVLALLYTTYRYIREEFMNINFNLIFELIVAVAVLWITSSELVYWMTIANPTESYKLGLSIFWGVYSLMLIALGIWKGKKHLRIGAIILFAITLIKLFAYDISHLNTISKTIVFISLGILLLIISFLYNKYKHVISDENEK
jgi:uncharacterized membrane protein